MAKNKLYDVDNELLKLTDNMREYIDGAVIDKPVQYLIKHTKEEYVYSAEIDYSGFKAYINLSPSAHILATFLDLKLKYEGSPYEFSIFDIFNLFDIQDFKQYYVEDVTTKTQLENGISELLSVLEEYRYDINKAGEERNLERLCENFEADWNSVTDGNESWKDEMMGDGLFLDLVHPYFTNASDNKTEKIHERLKKKEAKGKLDTLYEKRLLKYLDSGNEFDETLQAGSVDRDRGYAKLKAKISVIVLIVSIIVSIILVLAGEKLVFGSYTVLRHYVSVFGKNIIPNEILGATAAGLIGYALINSLTIKRFLVRFAPEEKKQLYAEKYDNELANSKGFFSLGKYKAVRIIARLLLAFIFVFVIIFTVNWRIGETADSVKYSASDTIGMCEIKKEELILYSLEGYYNGEVSDENFEKYDSPWYVITDSKGNYFELSDVYEGGAYDKLVKSLQSDYGKKVTPVKAMENIKEIKDY